MYVPTWYETKSGTEQGRDLNGALDFVKLQELSNSDSNKIEGRDTPKKKKDSSKFSTKKRDCSS